MGFQIMPTTLLGAIFRPSYGPDKTMQAETMHLVFTVCNLNNFKTIEVWVDKQLLEFLEYHKSTVQLPNQFCKIISSTQFKGHRWNCKVNQEFSLSISGSFFSGLDPNICSCFKPEIHFLYQFWFFSAIASISGISQQLLIANSLVFYKAQLSNPEFWTFSQLFIARIMGFKTQVFNLQVLT